MKLKHIAGVVLGISFSFSALLFILRGRHEKNMERILRETSQTRKEHTVLEEQDTCEFGFSFVEELIEKDRSAKRLLLPGHRRQNFSGGLVNQDFMCLDTMDATENMWVSIFECHGNGRNQAVTFTTDGLIETAATQPHCLSVKNMVSTQVVLKKCDKNDATQIWATDGALGHVMPNMRPDYCLTPPLKQERGVDIQQCNRDNTNQRWQLIMNEVLLLLQEGVGSDVRVMKKKSTRKQMEKLILQNRPIVNEDDGLLF